MCETNQNYNIYSIYQLFNIRFVVWNIAIFVSNSGIKSSASYNCEKYRQKVMEIQLWDFLFKKSFWQE